MADIRGFQGVRYETSHAQAPLADLAAPPYDIISPDEQAALYAKHPKNVVRLILGTEADKYQRAGQLFREWLQDGTLATDSTESVYVYRQSFADPVTGAPCPERIGLVCLLKLEEYASGIVLPHENTLTSAKADRLELLRATQAQFESIYGLYSDPDRAVQSFLGEYDDREAIMETVPDEIGSSHAIERIADENAIAALQTLMRDKQIFIADGHHRYETALNYRREVRAKNDTPDNELIAEDYILITLTAFEDEGLLVLPTHRLVRGVSDAALTGLADALQQDFDIVPLSSDTTLEAEILNQSHAGKTAFGIITKEGVTLAILRAAPDALASLVNGPQSDAVKQLPVTLLHSLILEQKLGIGANALAAGGQVSYTRDASEAEARVKSGEFQAAFVLGRPLVSEVRDVSLAGDKMPQKSTFFFPKLLSGLLLRDLRLPPSQEGAEH